MAKAEGFIFPILIGRIKNQPSHQIIALIMLFCHFSYKRKL